MIFTPPSNRAPWLLAALAVLSFSFGALLTLRAVNESVSFAALLSYTAGAALLAVCLPVGYWAFAALTLRYELLGDSLVIHWGFVEHTVPIASIERAVLGRHMPAPVVSGLRVAGLRVGRATVSKLGQATVYLRYRSPENLLYLITSSGAIGISLNDSRPFVQAIERARQDGASQGAPAGLVRGPLSAVAFWSDPTALMLGAGALALAWMSTAIVFVRYQAQSAAPLLHFPATESAHLGPRGALLQIPEGAMAWFAVSAVLSLLLLWAKGRVASYIVLGGSVCAGALFVVAAIAATG